MTAEWGRPVDGDETPRTAPNPSAGTPPILNETTSLLQAILRELREAHSLQENPTRGQFVLSPDAANSPNGRIVQGANKIRMERLVLLASGAVTFTIQTGSAAYLTLPPTFAAIFTVIDLPFAYVLDRGVGLQILAGVATWAGYAIGYPE
jgi:hypothetical protein